MIAEQTIVGRSGRTIYCDISEFCFCMTVDVTDAYRLRRALVVAAIPKYMKRLALKQIHQVEFEIYDDIYTEQNRKEEIDHVTDIVSSLLVTGIIVGCGFLIWWTLWIGG